MQEELKRFLDMVENSSSGVSIYEQSTKLLERFVLDEAYRAEFEPRIERKVEKIKAKMGLAVDEDQKIAFSLFSAYLRWVKEDPEVGNVSLKGGFNFNQGYVMVKSSSDEWRDSYQDYLQYEKPDAVDHEVIQKLLWFESPTFPGRAPLTSYYGCVLPDEETFPHEFYFYDGGVIYPLPFQTYEAYILALIANAGVDCWQYFYVDPKLIVEKNKGLNYMTTQLRIGTRLVENMKIYEYDDSYKIDRLDLIMEYLRRCVRALPNAFPDLKLDHQQAFLSKLEGLL